MRGIAACLVMATVLVGCSGGKDKSGAGATPAKQAVSTPAGQPPKAATTKPGQRVLTRAELARVPDAASFLTSGPPAAAEKGCQWQWKVPSPLVFIQSNGFWVTFYLKQNGTSIWGMAGYKVGNREVWGNVRGGITGERFFAKVYWTFSGVSSIGVYIGEIQYAYIFQGRTYDELRTPAIVENFSSHPLFICAPP